MSHYSMLIQSVSAFHSFILYQFSFKSFDSFCDRIAISYTLIHSSISTTPTSVAFTSAIFRHAPRMYLTDLCQFLRQSRRYFWIFIRLVPHIIFNACPPDSDHIIDVIGFQILDQDTSHWFLYTSSNSSSILAISFTLWSDCQPLYLDSTIAWSHPAIEKIPSQSAYYLVKDRNVISQWFLYWLPSFRRRFVFILQPLSSRRSRLYLLCHCSQVSNIRINAICNGTH